MCGLVYVKRKDGRPAYKAVLKRYRKQKNRGQEGFGYVAIKDNQVVAYERAPTEHEIVKKMEKETAEEILFHHRFPTSTPNIEEAAHPILVASDKLAHTYLIAHNGVIRNTKDLRKKHLELGMTYNTDIIKGFTAVSSKRVYESDIAWNDSESLAIETALALEGLKATIDTEGAAAVIGIKTQGAQVIERFFYRNNLHPMMFKEDKHMIEITSLGAGNFVSVLGVFKLNPNGGYQAYEKLEPPKGYKSDNYVKKTWDYEKKEWVEDKPGLPAPRFQRHMGFGRPANMYGHPTDWEDDEMSLREYAGSDARRLGEIMKEVDDIQFNANDMDGDALLSTMTLDVLWGEYDKALGAEEALKEQIQQVDRIVEDVGLTDDISNSKLELEDKLRDVQVYQERLDKEINRKEAIMHEAMSK